MKTKGKISQTEMIRRWLEDGHKITPLLALGLFDCLSLAQRIQDLRKEGMNIRTDFKTDHNTNKTYAEYSLAKN